MLPIYEYDGTLAGNLLENTDVVNALTSSDTTKPLSAAQGKVLNDKITNVAGKILQVGRVTCNFYGDNYLEGIVALQGFTYDVNKHNIFVTMRTVPGSAYENVKGISCEGEGQNVTIWLGGTFTRGHVVNVFYMIVEKVGD